jgi:hypothetical protein
MNRFSRASALGGGLRTGWRCGADAGRVGGRLRGVAAAFVPVPFGLSPGPE